MGRRVDRVHVEVLEEHVLRVERGPGPEGRPGHVDRIGVSEEGAGARELDRVRLRGVAERARHVLPAEDGRVVAVDDAAGTREAGHRDVRAPDPAPAATLNHAVVVDERERLEGAPGREADDRAAGHADEGGSTAAASGDLSVVPDLDVRVHPPPERRPAAHVHGAAGAREAPEAERIARADNAVVADDADGASRPRDVEPGGTRDEDRGWTRLPSVRHSATGVVAIDPAVVDERVDGADHEENAHPLVRRDGPEGVIDDAVVDEDLGGGTVPDVDRVAHLNDRGVGEGGRARGRLDHAVREDGREEEKTQREGEPPQRIQGPHTEPPSQTGGGARRGRRSARRRSGSIRVETLQSAPQNTTEVDASQRYSGSDRVIREPGPTFRAPRTAAGGQHPRMMPPGEGRQE